MHTMTCQCSQCRSDKNAEFEVLGFDTSPQQGEFEHEDEYEDEDKYASAGELEGDNEFENFAEYAGGDATGILSEDEEAELAMELLSVASEEELDQFLGKLFKKVGRGLKKVGRPLGRALKGLAKKALPFVGGALGSFIPIPGVGTAVGSALGGVVANALEAEFGELGQDEQEYEMARRFVRIASTAAQHAARAGDTANPHTAAHAAVDAAAHKHISQIGPTRTNGRWVRKGDRIIVVGV